MCVCVYVCVCVGYVCVCIHVCVMCLSQRIQTYCSYGKNFASLLHIWEMCVCNFASLCISRPFLYAINYVIINIMAKNSCMMKEGIWDSTFSSL